MDWKRLDSARESVGAMEVDLIEAYAQGRIRRRDFVKRGAVIGLSVPFMGAIIAACGGDDDDDGSGDTSASGTDAPAGSDAPTGSDAPAASGGVVVVANQLGDADSGLDPINTIDLGTYNVVSQSFEYLVGNSGTFDAVPALATEWTPNDDGSVWTFTLRENAVWSDGSPVTSADVAATMDRLAEANNAGLGGVIDVGSTDSSDPAVAVITLIAPNGNFPLLVSPWNAQSYITPVDYTTGTLLNERPEGSGPFKLDDWDAATATATFVRNDQWWGGMTPLDGVVLRGFGDIGTMVAAMQSREVDAIQQFSVLGGEGLLNDPNLNVIEVPASTHRQVWFNLVADGSPFQDQLVRQAVAWAMDREQMVSTLWNGSAVVANDAPVYPELAFYDAEAVEQRSFNAERASELLAEAGVENLSVTLETGDLQEIPELAQIIQQNLAQVGIDVSVNTQSNATFYGVGAPWACPDPDNGTDTVPCPTAAPFGVIDYGHRPTPDLYLTSALMSGGVWNSSNYANPDFDAAVGEYQAAVDVDSQKAAMAKIQTALWEDVPSVYPYFYNYFAATDSSVQGMDVSALGHTNLSAATKS